MLDYKEELKLGTYNANFGQAWNEVASIGTRWHRRIRLVEASAAGQRHARRFGNGSTSDWWSSRSSSSVPDPLISALLGLVAAWCWP